jgi:long-chain acyl-CoA synthetase
MYSMVKFIRFASTISTYEFFKEYHKDHEATKAAFIEFPPHSHTLHWFKTGDYGYMDENDFLYLVGRMADLIRFNDEEGNSRIISPIEVENALLQHDGVFEAIAFGAPSDKDQSPGDQGTVVQVHAAVVLETAARHHVSEEILIDFVKTILSPEKVPAHVYIVDAIPKTATGKKIRRRVKALVKKDSSTTSHL